MRTLLMSLLIIFCMAIANADDTNKVSVSLSINDIEVSNMPEDIRNVPIHEDDTGTPGPIAETDYNTFITLGAHKTLYSAEIGKATVKMKLCWVMCIGDIERRNYTNAPGTDQRGYGAALTYLRLEQRALPQISDSQWINVLTNINPEIAIEIPLSESYFYEPWILDATLGYTRLQAETGYDRYDSLQIRKCYTLANCFPATIGLSKNKIGAGIKYIFILPTDKGKEATINSNLTGYVSYKF